MGAHFIPLEIVFRFGVTKGSSFLARAQTSYLKELGFTSDRISENENFGVPILEFFTKHEYTDRFLAISEAFLISSLSAQNYRKLINSNLLLSIWLKDVFGDLGLNLIDGKTEWAIDESEDLILVDSIGPDELRILDTTAQFQLSKEFLRGFYRDSKWYATVNEWKAKTADWKKKVEDSVGNPPTLSAAYLSAAQNIYSVLTSIIATKTSTDTLSTQKKIQNLLKEMAECSK